jgi:hypothetical protein
VPPPVSFSPFVFCREQSRQNTGALSCHCASHGRRRAGLSGGTALLQRLRSTGGIGAGADRIDDTAAASAAPIRDDLLPLHRSDVLKFSRFAIEPRVSSRITLPLCPVPCSRIVLPCRCLCARRAPPSCSLRRPHTHAQRLLLSARTWEPPLFGRSPPRGGRRRSSRPPCSFRRQRTRTQLAVLAS